MAKLEEAFDLHDTNGTGMFHFHGFCYFMIKLRAERRRRVINPQNDKLEDLIKQGLSIGECAYAGFTLADFHALKESEPFSVTELFNEEAFGDVGAHRAFRPSAFRIGGISIMKFNSENKSRHCPH